MVTYYEKLPPIKSHNPSSTWSRDELKNISVTTIPRATKPGRVVTYNEELPSIKSHGSLISWSCDFDFSYTILKEQ